MNKKIYVLDTNVLIEDPDVIYSFHNALIGIPISVLEELDKIKVESTSRGANARLISRYLDKIRLKGDISEGIKIQNGISVKILFNNLADNCIEPDLKKLGKLDFSCIDNQILLLLCGLKQEGYTVVFVSKDINARIKAAALGFNTKDHVRSLILADNYYMGYKEFKVNSEEFFSKSPKIIADLVKNKALLNNEFILLTSIGNDFKHRLFRHFTNGFVKEINSIKNKWNITHKNIYQLMALELLFDNDIKMITFSGPAGTGKTFLTLFGALYQVLVAQMFTRLVVARSVVPLGHDIGYLPGDISEKLHGWMQPIYDNVDIISSAISAKNKFEYLDFNSGDKETFDIFKKGKAKERFKKSKFRHVKSIQKEAEIRSLDDLIRKNKVSLEAIVYMRGRSIANQFVFIDEAQNLTAHEIKTLLSRIGEGSKIILSGDPYQIDVPYLDFSTNGLVVATDKFKGQSIFGSVYLPISERSALSQLVQELF